MIPYDVLLDEDGDLPVVTQHVNDYRITIQRLTVRLSTHFQEVIFDRFAGIPFRDWAQQRPPQHAVWDQTIRNLILNCPGVGGLSNFQRVTSGESTSWTGVIHEVSGNDLLLVYTPFRPSVQTQNWHPVNLTLSTLGKIR